MKGALKATRAVVALYWHDWFPPKIEHQLIEVSISVKGQELIGCDSDHLYYVTKWGGIGDQDGWAELLRPNGSLWAPGSLDPSLSLADLSIRVRPKGKR